MHVRIPFGISDIHWHLVEFITEIEFNLNRDLRKRRKDLEGEEDKGGEEELICWEEQRDDGRAGERSVLLNVIF